MKRSSHTALLYSALFHHELAALHDRYSLHRYPNLRLTEGVEQRAISADKRCFPPLENNVSIPDGERFSSDGLGRFLHNKSAVSLATSRWEKRAFRLVLLVRWLSQEHATLVMLKKHVERSSHGR